MTLFMAFSLSSCATAFGPCEATAIISNIQQLLLSRAGVGYKSIRCGLPGPVNYGCWGNLKSKTTQAFRPILANNGTSLPTTSCLLNLSHLRQVDEGRKSAARGIRGGVGHTPQQRRQQLIVGTAELLKSLRRASQANDQCQGCVPDLHDRPQSATFPL